METNDPADQDVISLVELLAPLWHARKMMVAVASLTAVLGGALTLYQAKYRSDGFLQFGGAIPLVKESFGKEISPGILLGDYKRYVAAFNTSGRFDEFVKQNKLKDVVGVSGLRRMFSSPEGIVPLIEPVYPFTKLDAKELMDQPKDGGNNVIGLRINFESDSPENAQRMVGLLGNYALDSIIYLIYSDALRYKHAEITAKITKLDNDIIENKEKLAIYQRKGATLKQIVARYPESSKYTASQVVTVTEENSRYLPPATHLMTTEVDALNANEAIIKFKREQRRNFLLREYYDQAKKVLDENKSGAAILRALEPVKDAVFKNKDLNDELVKQVYNLISIDNQSAITLYLDKSRFIAGPSLPENRTTRLSTMLMYSFLGGLLMSALFVMLRKWWNENRFMLNS